MPVSKHCAKWTWISTNRECGKAACSEWSLQKIYSTWLREQISHMELHASEAFRSQQNLENDDYWIGVFQIKKYRRQSKENHWKRIVGYGWVGYKLCSRA